MRRRTHDLVERAASTRAAGSDLGAVEHVVFLMQENRSFDHYFGSLGGVNGFDADSTAFAQAWPNGAASTLLPFRLDPKTNDAECTYDLNHTWQAEHASWNNGAMDSFVSTHTSTTYDGKEAKTLGTTTMGYYESADLPFYYALAKNFTICDAYFCSVLGPTHPNRMLQMTGTLDPAGVAGGPVLITNSDPDVEFTCSWTTMPEILTDAGVSWKVYNPYGINYQPGSGLSMDLCKNPLMYFKQYQQSVNPTLYQNAFGYYGPGVLNELGYTGGKGPDNFAKDVKANELPAVSWIVAPIGFDEHPPAPAALGEWYSSQVLKTLMSNPKVWKSTVLFIMYDENDGFFDHVPPPTAPAGTEGEYVTASSASGFDGPIGLGVRVPMLVVSPFSAGGWVCSDTFDHTSQLKFLAERFGVSIPNISSWRKNLVGDLTATLPTLGSPITKAPTLPSTSDNIDKAPIEGECNASQINELNPTTPPYPIPSNQVQPTQEPGTLKPTPS
jgi:phospholipase C